MFVVLYGQIAIEGQTDITIIERASCSIDKVWLRAVCKKCRGTWHKREDRGLLFLQTQCKVEV